MPICRGLSVVYIRGWAYQRVANKKKDWPATRPDDVLTLIRLGAVNGSKINESGNVNNSR